MLDCDNCKELDCGRAALRVAIQDYITSLIPVRAQIVKERVVICWRCTKCNRTGSAEAGTEKQAVYVMRRDHRIASNGLCRMERLSRTIRYQANS